MFPGKKEEGEEELWVEEEFRSEDVRGFILVILVDLSSSLHSFRIGILTTNGERSDAIEV